jgi:hypothetical protein
LAVEFKARRPARTQTCERCGERAAGTWHHWLGQSELKRIMRGYARLAGWDPPDVAKRLRRWLRDERNLTAMCHDCHEAGENTITRRFTPSEVPLDAVSFCQELDNELEAAGRPREAVVTLSRSYR